MFYEIYNQRRDVRVYEF